MRCAATLASGQRCERDCEEDSKLCSYHQKTNGRRSTREFYTKHLVPEEQRAVIDATELEGIEAEIPMLRVLIRRVVDAGDFEAARMGIGTLMELIKLQQKLQTTSAHAPLQPAPADSMLERVVDLLCDEWAEDNPLRDRLADALDACLEELNEAAERDGEREQ